MDEDYLILSTIHSAKGQEWNSMLVLNCVDGCIPSDLGVGTRHELEEEWRLLYVALTGPYDGFMLEAGRTLYLRAQKRSASN